ARSLRRSGKPVVVAVNKLEGARGGVDEFARLGFATLLALSAEHGQGVGGLLDAALEAIPNVAPPDEPQPRVRLALVGRRTVGTSSRLNRLPGSGRPVVSPIAGTSRDALDSLVQHAGERYLFVATAGIRRVRLLKDNVDHVSVVQARHSIGR